MARIPARLQCLLQTVVYLCLRIGFVRSQAVQISGYGHNCAILLDTTSKCWGSGFNGRLGNGNTLTLGDGPNEMGNNLPTVDFGTGRSAVHIAVSNAHTCALLDDGTVKCWGFGGNGRLGSGATATLGDQPNEMGNNLLAVDLGTGRTATQIAAGELHNCAVLDDASLKCWGLNNRGQLGLGDTVDRGDGPNEMGDNLPTVDLGTGRTAVQVATGIFHTCVILDNNSLKCWGDGAFGRLGYGNSNTRGGLPNQMGNNLQTVDLGTGRTAKSVEVGDEHTCVVLDDDSLKCWGRAVFGRLGSENVFNIGDNVNEMGDNLSPVNLGTGRSVKEVSAGKFHTCALLDDNTVKCWGRAQEGQLGYGDAVDRGNSAGQMGDSLAAVDLGTGRTAVQVYAGPGHTCVITDLTNAKCWGAGTNGVLGYGDTLIRGDGPNEMGDNLPVIDLGPTPSPTAFPTSSPTTSFPSVSPTTSPTNAPSVSPSRFPTSSPTTPQPSNSLLEVALIGGIAAGAVAVAAAFMYVWKFRGPRAAATTTQVKA